MISTVIIRTQRIALLFDRPTLHITLVLTYLPTASQTSIRAVHNALVSDGAFQATIVAAASGAVFAVPVMSSPTFTYTLQRGTLLSADEQVRVV